MALGWLGIHSLNVVLLKNLIDNSGSDRRLRALIMVFCHVYPRMAQGTVLENVIGVPFRTQVCPPHVWLRGLSLWMT